MEILSNNKIHQSIQKTVIPISRDDNFEIIWIDDLHFDNPDTDKTKLKKILESKPTAYICIGGDAFDLMDSFGDPRQSKDRISKNQWSDTYVNDILKSFVDFFQPYAKRLLCINFGNHEGSFLKRYGTDIGAIAASMLNDRTGSSIVCGDYAGYINLCFQKDGIVNESRSKIIYYTHSSGSSGKRTKGTLAIDILKGQHPSADIIIFGHDHDTFIKPEPVEIMARNKMKLEEKLMWFISAPTTKDEFIGPKRGFHHEKNMGKRTIGVIVMSFCLNFKHQRFDVICKTPDYIFFRDL